MPSHLSPKRSFWRPFVRKSNGDAGKPPAGMGFLCQRAPGKREHKPMEAAPRMRGLLPPSERLFSPAGQCGDCALRRTETRVGFPPERRSPPYFRTGSERESPQAARTAVDPGHPPHEIVNTIITSRGETEPGQCQPSLWRCMTHAARPGNRPVPAVDRSGHAGARVPTTRPSRRGAAVRRFCTSLPDAKEPAKARTMQLVFWIPRGFSMLDFRLSLILGAISRILPRR